MGLSFDITAKDGQARAGVLRTEHGEIETPCVTLNFTTALEKWGFKPEEITSTKDVILLRNTFWMREAGKSDVRDGIEWQGPVMSDSGGFQMVSLGKHLRQSFAGIGFDLNGKKTFITPREVVKWANKAGVDLIMPLDNTVYTMAKNPFQFIWSAIMTMVWHKQSRGIVDDKLYYIVQGGLNKLARTISLWDATRQLRNGIPAVAIGGLAWDEPRRAMVKMVKFCIRRLPENKPRHMLGICKPIDVLMTIREGMDTFDGIAATREGRHGRVWMRGGKHYDIKNAQFENDERVLDESCQCPTCRSGISRAELRRKFKAKDREAIRGLMVHNWHHNYELVRGAREAIIQGRLGEYIGEYMR
ncbi:MAG: tRNA-guanine transglycosylase [Patescibacteria group bacterium]